MVCRIRVPSLACLLVLAGLPACGSSSGDGDGSSDDTGTGSTATGNEPLSTAMSELPRDDSPSPSTATLEQMRLGEWAFAHELYGELTTSTFEPGANLMLSPYSLRAAFGMSWAGAVGATETQMAEVLRFESGQAATHEALNYLSLELADRNDEGDADHPPIVVLSNNRFFVHFDLAILDSFLDVLAVNYGAGVELVDFRDGEAARMLMNEWVADKTLDRIVELLPGGSIQDLTPMGGTVSVLINTLYLKAPWNVPFDEDATQTTPFTLRDGTTTDVPMMYHEAVSSAYAVVDGYELVDLYLRQGDLSMTMILPPATEDPALDQWFEPQQLQVMLDSLVQTHLELRVPRFTLVGETIPLKESFWALGMEAPFMGGFENAYPGGGVFIDNIYHQVFFAIDEAGVEGAAATAIVMGGGFSPQEPPTAEYTVTFDRPFLVLVRDRATGTLLFMGRVNQPG
jgi:serpin B